jgi:hypothetical protein
MSTNGPNLAYIVSNDDGKCIVETPNQQQRYHLAQTPVNSRKSILEPYIIMVKYLINSGDIPSVGIKTLGLFAVFIQSLLLFVVTDRSDKWQ